MKKKIVELLIDEDSLNDGIFAISLVDFPAIEENFMVFSDNKYNVTFAKIDAEKRILTGPALIPNKEIYRYNPETNEEYFVYFSPETVEQASQMYLMNHKQDNATLMHEEDIKGVSLVESWLVTDETNDKAIAMGYDVPVGTWMVSLKINNDEIWENQIKTEEVKGFSIEGFFTQKFDGALEPKIERMLDKIIRILEQIEDNTK